MSTDFIIYVADTETTGLSEIDHEIIEISLYRLSDNSQKTWHLKPEKFDTITKDALRINGHKVEDLKQQTKYGKDTYIDPEQALGQIEAWMLEDNSSVTDRILVGQNIVFDLRFMMALWKKHNSIQTFPFGPRPLLLDTIQIALFLDLIQDKRSEYYNLGSLVERYGVKKEKAHRSEFDCRMTKEVLLSQMRTVQNMIKK